MTTQLNAQNIKNVVDKLTGQDYNNDECLAQFPDIKKVIVTGLRSEIRIINNMNADVDFKEEIRWQLGLLDVFDLNAHVKLFNTVVLRASTYILNKALTMGEMIDRLIPERLNDIEATDN